MTVETKDDVLVDNHCVKCGSSMAYRKRKLASGEISTIFQCIVCRHYVIIDEK